MRVFVDNNLWAYRLDRREPGKSAFVRDWLRELALEALASFEVVPANASEHRP